MSLKILFALTGISLIYFTSLQASSWSYEGKTGPDKWGGLEKNYITCNVGKKQSPINLSAKHKAELPPIDLKYKLQKLSVKNNGHTIVLNPTEKNILVVGDQTYKLQQFHLHTPSEHTINGKSYPLEIHFVHANNKGELAVAGLMVEESSAVSIYSERAYKLKEITELLPIAIGQEVKTQSSFNLPNLFSNELAYITYNGSLTNATVF